ncbi:hypothetical protein BB558_004668 [Smittium angustum]|uniref:Lysosomal dipeptide transporter MFSD1 n=1 Tax=Smittium angustum TaxID=133377 RepID=A0A2U1J2R4_SMIAN|nr:hypothetical protein BB558_004668 [Smittium angustum]
MNGKQNLDLKVEFIGEHSPLAGTSHKNSLSQEDSFIQTSNQSHNETNHEHISRIFQGSPVDLSGSENIEEIDEAGREFNDGSSTDPNLFKYKFFALLCTLLISVGSHYSAHTLGALKSTIKKELDITNAQYGALQSSVSLVNTIIPVLGGLFIDSFGTSLGSLLATSLIMTGSVIVAISTNMSSFGVMVLGRIIYGLGSGTIVTVQETILGHWFRGSSLAVTIALQISTARLSSFLSMGTAVPIANWVGFYGAAFWASSLVCVLSFIVNLMYWYQMKHIHKRTDVSSLQKLILKNKFNPGLIFLFSGLFWLITAESFVLGSSWTTFLHINSEFIKLKFGVNDEIAAWNASISQLLPVFLVPFLGMFVDKYGRRPELIITSSTTFLLSILILGFTMVSPIIGMLIFSISLALGPVCLISSVALIIPSGMLGTAYGIYKSAQNVGNTVVDIWVGQLQDNNTDGIITSKDYQRVMYFYIFWSILAIAIGTLISYIDKKYHLSLLYSNKDYRIHALEYFRENSEVHGDLQPQSILSSMINLPKSYPVLVWIGFLLYSWYLFGKYLL